MPVWATLFRSLDPHDPVKVNQRIQTLVDYLKTHQANWRRQGHWTQGRVRRSLDR
jgi:hypothetical protein